MREEMNTIQKTVAFLTLGCKVNPSFFLFFQRVLWYSLKHKF